MSMLGRLWAGWWIWTTVAILLGILLALWMSWTGRRAANLAVLPALGAQLQGTTLSGISAGAYMAGQFQFSHADIVSGAGIIAGGPYGCAETAFSGVVPSGGNVFLNASRAVSGCMMDTLALWGIPNPQQLAEMARTMADENQIGNIADVVTDRLYMFSGTQDSVVKPEIVKAAATLYRNLGLPDGNIMFVQNIPAGHAFVTVDKGLACSESRSPFINDCDYDQAGAMLKQVLGEDLAAPQDPVRGEFLEFSQDEFTRDLPDHGLAQSGVVFIPDSCRNEAGCRVHVAFHGCLQNRPSVGDAFIRDSGLARWAATNRLIVLFPEVTFAALNPQACWDWWGYTGRSYLTKDAPQIRAVRSMLDRLAEPPSKS